MSKTFPKGTKPKAIVEYIRGEMPKTEKPGRWSGSTTCLRLHPPGQPLRVGGAGELDQIGREHAFYLVDPMGETSREE